MLETLKVKLVSPKTLSLKVHPSDIEELARELNECLECHHKPLSHDEVSGEVYCKKCAVVWGRDIEACRIPFEEESSERGHSESHYSPGSHLDFENGLGSNTNRSAVADVLGSRKDPFDWTRARSMHVSFTAPLIKDLKKFGSEFMKKHALDEKTNDHHHWFADQLGIYLQKIGEYYLQGMGKQWCDPWRMAAAMFSLMFRDVYPLRYQKIRDEMGNDGMKARFPELCLPSEVLEYYGLLLKNCHPNVLPKLENE